MLPGFSILQRLVFSHFTILYNSSSPAYSFVDNIKNKEKGNLTMTFRVLV